MPLTHRGMIKLGSNVLNKTGTFIQCLRFISIKGVKYCQHFPMTGCTENFFEYEVLLEMHSLF